MLQHRQTGKIRIVMRRDKTLKICANHTIIKEMELKPNVGSDRSWVYTAPGDLSEGEPVTELLAVRFANAENAAQFKAKFEAAQRNNAGEELITGLQEEGEDVKEESLEKGNVKGEEVKTEDNKTETKADETEKEEEKGEK